MKKQSHRNAKKYSRTLGILYVACLTWMTGAAHGSGFPVIDGAHIGTNKFAWVQQYQQMYNDMKKQIQQYETQIRELESKYVRGEAFSGGAGYRETLSERGLNAFVMERCGNGSNLPSAPQRVADIARRQFQNCVAIVQTENTRYNVMVRILESLAERDRQMDQIKRAAENVSEDQPGELERVNNNISQFEARLATDIQNAKTLLEAYDASLQALHSEQVWLGQSAFSNRASSRSGIGQLIDTGVRYGTLKAALTVARQRER